MSDSISLRKDERIHEIRDGAGYVRCTEEYESHPDCPPCLSIRVGFHGEDDWNEVSLFEEDVEFLLGVFTGWLAARRDEK